MVRTSAPSYGTYLTIVHMVFKNTQPKFGLHTVSSSAYVKYLTIAHVLFENTQPQFENDDSSYSNFHTVSFNSC